MNKATTLLLGGALLFAISGLFGCSGGAKHTVKGRVTNKGEPMAVKENVGKLMVTFLQEDVPPPVDPKFANVKADGTFNIPDGVPAGKYKILVEWYDEFPDGKEKLNGKFDEANSKIFRKIPDDGFLEIDVSKPEGK